MEIILLFNYLVTPLLMLLTLFGSTAGLIVFSRPKLQKIGPRNIYRFMFAFEYFNVIIIIDYVNNFDINLLRLSSFICQFVWLLYSIYMPIPAMLLVYISIERYVSIAYPARRLFLRKKHIQMIYFLVLIIFNICLYLFLFFYADIQEIANSNSTESSNKIKFGIRCVISNQNALWAFIYIDFINRVVVPFLLMTLMAIMLIRQIYLSRKKFISSKSASKQRTFNRDVKFSLSITSINLVYLVFSLFYSSGYFFGFFFSNYNLYFFFEYITFFCYSLDFYVILATNSLVRKEVCSMLRKNHLRN